MAIALAEADKYEILEKIGRLHNVLQCPVSNANSCRLWIIWYHSKGQAKVRWIRKLAWD